MPEIVTFQANDNASTELAVAGPNAAVPIRYVSLEGFDLGMPNWNTKYSQPIGTQGGRSAQSSIQNRKVTVPLRVYGTDVDDFASNRSALDAIVDLMRRHGGRIFVKLWGQTYGQWFDVLGGQLGISTKSVRKIENQHVQDVSVSATCAPYSSGDDMDFWEDFSGTNPLDDFTAFEFGGAHLGIGGSASPGDKTNLEIVQQDFTRGVAVNDTSDNDDPVILYESRRGYVYGDAMIEARIVFNDPADVEDIGILAGVNPDNPSTNEWAGVLIRPNDTGTHANGELLTIGGATTQSTNLPSAPAAGETWWLRLFIQGDTLYSVVVEQTDRPDILENTTTGATTTWPAADGTVWVRPGIIIRADGTGGGTKDIITDLRVYPLSRYRASSVTVPMLGTWQPRMNIPGDAPALVTMETHHLGAGGDQPAWWGVGWSPVPLPYNKIIAGNGDLYPVTNHWKTAALGSVHAASTTVDTVTTGDIKFGTRMIRIQTSATLNSGAHLRVFETLRDGVEYTMSCWIRGDDAGGDWALRTSQNTSTRETSSTVTVSSTWQQITHTWTNTTEDGNVNISLFQDDAVADTVYVDGLTLYEGSEAPSIHTQIEGRGAPPPLGIIPWQARYRTVQDQLDNVATDEATTGTWGWDCFGGQVDLDGGSFTGELATTRWRVDPNLLQPDDHSSSEIDITFYGMFRDPGEDDLVSPEVLLSASPREDLHTSALTEARRFTREHGKTFVAMPRGHASTEQDMAMRLGTITFPVNPTDPLFWYVMLEMQFDEAGSDDAEHWGMIGLFAFPARAYASSADLNPLTPGYARYAPSNSNGLDIQRRINPDLSGALGYSGEALAPSAGLGGSLLEWSPGASAIVIGGFGGGINIALGPADATQFEHDTVPLFGIRPRWHGLRDS
jgi:hypothetical protein